MSDSSMAIFCVKYAGYLLKQDYQDGSRVGAGQLLFEIDPRQYQATLDQALGTLAQAEAQLKQNQTDPARYTKLFKSSVIPAQQFDNSTQTTRPSAARVAVYGAFLGLWWRRLNNATGRSSISPPRI
jgi:membrane fusion protein (multidrug efflux system)